MPKLTEDEIDGLLTTAGGVYGASSWPCRLATVGKDGFPVIVPLGFVCRDRTIYLTARAEAAWLGDIRRNPQVCVSVEDSLYARQKVTIRGTAEIVHDLGRDDEWRELRLPLQDPSWTGPTVLPDGREQWTWGEAYSLMTRDEPRVLVAIPLDASKVTSWRTPVEGELLDSAWAPRYFSGQPRRFRVQHLGSSANEWLVIAEPTTQVTPEA